MGSNKTKAELERELTQLKGLAEKVSRRVHEAIENGDICREGGISFLQELNLDLPRAQVSGHATVSLEITDGRAVVDRWGDIASEFYDDIYSEIEGAIRVALENASFSHGATVRFEDVIDWDVRAED